jgi:hypothetical protein
MTEGHFEKSCRETNRNRHAFQENEQGRLIAWSSHAKRVILTRILSNLAIADGEIKTHARLVTGFGGAAGRKKKEKGLSFRGRKENLTMIRDETG